LWRGTGSRYARRMRRRLIGLLLAPTPLLLPALLTGACDDGAARVSLDMRYPQALLDDTTATLRVIPADETSCDSASGFIDPANPSNAQEFNFSTDCEPTPDGRTPVLCAQITLDKDGNDQVFEVQATRAGEVVARGCTVATVDQDPLDVAITVVPNLPPKCCNDGAIQVGEQCDTGAAAPDFCGTPVDNPVPGSCTGIVTDQVCECDCLAKEILLSTQDLDGQPGLDNSPGTKGDVSIAFSGGTGSSDVANSLRAVFTDGAQYAASTTGVDINQRLLAADLYPAENPLFDQQLRLKATCDGTLLDSPNGKALTQQQPDIARVSADRLAVVFADDLETGNPANDFNIRLIQLNGVGCGEPVDVKINASKTQSLAWPAVAGGPSGTAMVVWAEGGSVKGRLWESGADQSCSTCLPTGADLDVGALAANTRPRVAGNANGYHVAYAGPGTGTDIFIRNVDTLGNLGEPRTVNLNTDGDQTQPDIAMLEDGRMAVVWVDGGAIMFQRFDAQGNPISGDQDAPLSVGSPPGATPAIAGGADSNGFFAAVWAAGDGSLWGRFVGGGNDRFLRNSVNGTLDDFMASHPAIAGSRSVPDVAVGGAGFVAFAWNDPSGVFVRRFPLPSALQQ